MASEVVSCRLDNMRRLLQLPKCIQLKEEDTENGLRCKICIQSNTNQIRIAFGYRRKRVTRLLQIIHKDVIRTIKPDMRKKNRVICSSSFGKVICLSKTLIERNKVMIIGFGGTQTL